MPSKRTPEWKEKRRKLYEDSVDEVTTCKQCGREFDGTNYYFDAAKKFARRHLCNDCTRENLRKYSSNSRKSRRFNQGLKDGDPIATKRRGISMMMSGAVMARFITRPRGCTRCGVVCKPQAHHKTPCQELTMETLFDIEWLCQECHLEAHNGNFNE